MGICATVHNGNTRDKWMILQSDYIYCIYFHLSLLYNLMFLEYSFCEWKQARIQREHRGHVPLPMRKHGSHNLSRTDENF